MNGAEPFAALAAIGGGYAAGYGMQQGAYGGMPGYGGGGGYGAPAGGAATAATPLLVGTAGPSTVAAVLRGTASTLGTAVLLDMDSMAVGRQGAGILMLHTLLQGMAVVLPVAMVSMLIRRS